MKKRVILLVVLLFGGLLCAGLFRTAQEKDRADVISVNKAIDYSELFSLAAVSDGAISEQVGADLADAFDAQPEALLSAMADCPEEQLDSVVELLVYGKSYDDLDVLEQDILHRRSLLQGSDAEAPVLDKILAEITRFQNEINSANGTEGSTPPEAPLFQPDTIRSFIERCDPSSGIDEPFFELMADVYLSAPELLADILQDMEPDTVNYVAKGIAYDIIKRGAHTTEPADTASDPFSALVVSFIADSNGNLAALWPDPSAAAG